MSRRNTPSQKKLRRLRKVLRRSLPAYFDLYEWLETRGYADTSGQCRALVLAGRLKSESHTVGIVEGVESSAAGRLEKVRVIERLQPVALREHLRVEPA